MVSSNEAKTITISLPTDLADEAQRLADQHGETLDAFIANALRDARKERAMKELREIQAYWSQQAEELGIHTEEDLIRHLES